MDHPFIITNKQIKAEADHLLYEKGLYNLLRKYGEPHISGSYDLNLMTWRDLDIYLQVTEENENDFFLLGADINLSLQPIKMHFRNELIAKTPGLPLGLYWGVYLGNERTGAWKIDIWYMRSVECKRLLEYCAVLKEKVTPEAAVDIMNIKSQCWSDPQYRKSYTSSDIYQAVLERGIRTFEDFRKSYQ